MPFSCNVHRWPTCSTRLNSAMNSVRWLVSGCINIQSNANGLTCVHLRQTQQQRRQHYQYIECATFWLEVDTKMRGSSWNSKQQKTAKNQNQRALPKNILFTSFHFLHMNYDLFILFAERTHSTIVFFIHFHQSIVSRNSSLQVDQILHKYINLNVLLCCYTFYHIVCLPNNEF